MKKTIEERFIRYAKINTRSCAESTTVPSTMIQYDLLNLLVDELNELGLEDIKLNKDNAFVTAKLPGNLDNVPGIGFIAHVDTADFESENVNPQVHSNYAGSDIVLNEELDIHLKVDDFPNLKNYIGQTLITTDGTTLLGADDKAGIAAIFAVLEYFIKNPDIKSGPIHVAFGPDEEIGRGADRFEVDDFPVAFAYTVDGAEVGDFQYETFNAAQANITFEGMAVHPGTAKGKMIQAVSLVNDFINELPEDEVPEKTEGYEGFYMISKMNATTEEGYLEIIIRDHDKDKFQERKTFIKETINKLNNKLDKERITYQMFDQYYNMVEVIEKDMTCVDLAKEAMENLGIEIKIFPFRGGTDGSKISFKGIPTPNLFTGSENHHGRYEFVSVEGMELSAKTMIEIVELYAKRH